MRGLFLEPIDPIIQDELRRRRAILKGTADPGSTGLRVSSPVEPMEDFEWSYYFGKTPWIKIMSNALVKKDDDTYDDDKNIFLK